jgi:SH3-like domain-containing protein
LIAPWIRGEEPTVLYARRSTGSDVVARLEPNVLGSLLACDGEWCEFSLDAATGWVRQERLWGVYRGEKIE